MNTYTYILFFHPYTTGNTWISFLLISYSSWPQTFWSAIPFLLHRTLVPLRHNSVVWELQTHTALEGEGEALGEYQPQFPGIRPLSSYLHVGHAVLASVGWGHGWHYFSRPLQWHHASRWGYAGILVMPDCYMGLTLCGGNSSHPASHTCGRPRYNLTSKTPSKYSKDRNVCHLVLHLSL